jgi:hypothetical protein
MKMKVKWNDLPWQLLIVILIVLSVDHGYGQVGDGNWGKAAIPVADIR